ncbi:hypothetical protein A3770_17p78780 [Chloropicon primus]|nr:hypothetical protein A3770_17p78780 [Chloropicon primus]|mmetsp:Transcript_3765/g.10796  ORF Transcript_3765/g.10796 Transcript_3765/m.10796 type:complete len:356 (-) Transcript_3765:851-1918(-)|eukprot:QDZ25360.1 hypothetical protein A3770_17p78780 [Chloropicon primus]
MSKLMITIGNLTFEPKLMRPTIRTGVPAPEEEAKPLAGTESELLEGVLVAGATTDSTPAPHKPVDRLSLEVRKGPALASSGVSTSQVAVAVLHNIDHASAKEIYQSFRLSWIRHFKSTLMYVKHRKGSVGSDYLKIITQLKKKYPRKKWYVMVHDDTYVYARNLLSYLASYDEGEPLLLGSTHCSGPNFQCRSGGISEEGAAGWLGWATGGSGIILSSKAASKLQVKSCLKYYARRWDYKVPAADVILSCCAKDSGLQKFHNPGFVNGPPGHHECQCQRKGRPLCTLSGSSLNRGDPLYRRRLSYHHVSVGMMEDLFVTEMDSLRGDYGGKGVGTFDLDHAKVIHVRKKPAKTMS